MYDGISRGKLLAELLKRHKEIDKGRSHANLTMPIYDAVRLEEIETMRRLVEAAEPVRIRKPWMRLALPGEAEKNIEQDGMKLHRRVLKFAVQIEEHVDQAVVNACIEYALAQGMTDVLLLDGRFVLQALEEKMARMREEERCGEKI